jgi:hypothetical protein
MLTMLMLPGAAFAHGTPGAVLELRFTPAPRAQIAVWLEYADGRFIRTLALTEAVSFRGIGNRPGASQMNSGYRFPYGRREGVLPIWASRRAAAPGAQQFMRVVFQNRASEGAASRTSDDQSIDSYFCLSSDQATTRRDALDAMSCASVFASDKGRFITQDDDGYAEPWQDPATGAGSMEPLSQYSRYPPRSDVTRCTASDCYDHPDVRRFQDHARAVMPEIDAVSMATLPGFTEHSMLISLPDEWPTGSYAIWIEVNVEGDYNATYNDVSFATPTQPDGAWDTWAIDYGYPYRGQPSVAFTLPFELGAPGQTTDIAHAPVGRSAWDVWTPGYGVLEPLSGIADDPAGAPGSGADRLAQNSSGVRATLLIDTLEQLPAPVPGQELPDLTAPPTEPGEPQPPPLQGEPGTPQPDAGSPAPAPGPEPDDAGVVMIDAPDASSSPVGAVRGLALGRHPDELHSHEWITIGFRAAESEQPLHRYEVRVSEAPIENEEDFIRHGRQAKHPQGAMLLTLPADAPASERIEGQIGDLIALTRYWVGVRGVDRTGPISVAQIETTERASADVTPCFIATAAYGSQLAEQVRALRRVRDRYLMSHALGRSFVDLYYRHGPRLAALLHASEPLRAFARQLLSPLVALAARLERTESSPE